MRFDDWLNGPDWRAGRDRKLLEIAVAVAIIAAAIFVAWTGWLT